MLLGSTRSIGVRCIWATGLVDSHHDGVEFTLKLSLLGIEKSEILGVGLNELETLSDAGADGGDVNGGEERLQLSFLEDVAHLEAVVLKGVLGLNLLSDGIILSLELVGVGDHFLDLCLGKTTLIVGDNNLLGSTGGLIASGDVEDTVGIDLESNLDLGGTTGCGGDALEVELSEQVIVSGHLTLTFVNLDEDNWLVVSAGGESLLLLGGNGSVSGDDVGHDTTDGLDTLGEGSDIQKEEVLDLGGTLTGEDSGLNGSTVGNSLIGVDGSVEGLSVKEFLEHVLDLGDSGGTTDEDDFVDLSLGDVRILKDLLYGGHALSELGHAKLLELGAGDVDVEVLTFGEGLAEDLG